MATAKERAKRKAKIGSARRRAEQAETKGGFGSLKIPGGIPVFKVTTDDEFDIDILPYKIVTEGANPYAKDEDDEPLAAGSLYFERTYYEHSNIGANNGRYICPNRTFGKRCPVCEARAKLLQEGRDFKDPMVKALNASERQVFAVRPHGGDLKGKVCVWPVATFNFGQHLDKKIRKSKEDSGCDTFFDPEEGMSLQISPVEKDIGFKNKNYECTGIRFEQRDKPIPEAILEQVPDLDGMVKEVSYNDLRKVFLQTGDDDEGDDDTDASRNGTDDDDAPVKAKKSKPDMDQDDDEDDSELEDADADADTDDDDSELEEKPKVKKGKAAADEDEEEPTAEDLGIKTGDSVEHEDYGTCKVTKVSGDGTSLTLEDEDGDLHKAIAPADVTKAKKSKPAVKKGKVVDEDEDEDDSNDSSDDADGEDVDDSDDSDDDAEDSEDDSDDDEDESDDEDDGDSDSDEDDEDEEPAPKKAAKKPVKAPAKKGGKK